MRTICLKFYLTTKQKNTLDTILGILGGVFGNLATGALKLPADYQIYGSLIGLAGGYFILTALGIIDTGALPSATTVVTQFASLWDTPNGIKAIVTADVNSLITDPTKKEVAMLVITAIDQQIQLATVKPIPPASPLASLKTA